MKFGGTSVGSPERMKNVAQLVTKSNDQTFVVLSAMSGTTNSLVEISDYLYKKNPEGANEHINALENTYMRHVETLYSTEEYKEKTRSFLREEFNYLRSFTKDLFTSFEEKSIVAQGEIISTNMVANYMQEQGFNVCLLNALDFMRTDKNVEPDPHYIKEKLTDIMNDHQGHQVYITQGFICRNAYGEIDNLQRGGSDYTASLIGVSLNAEEIQIWTDIDGVHNSDPRYVKNTKAIRSLSFDEAAELAYFGAKILHPSSIQPAKKANIPVRMKNTMNPSDEGTLITKESPIQDFKAVAAKDGITAIKVKSSNMLLAYGFVRKVFEIFESWKTPIDMIATSEVAISLTIDSTCHLEDIQKDLAKYGTIEVEESLSIICIVGDCSINNSGLAARALTALKDIPLHMISYGASEHSISLLVKQTDKQKALEALSERLLNQ